MNFIKRVLRYLNPIARLGTKRYSILFPLVTTTFFAVILEIVAVRVLNNPEIVGVSAIFLFMSLVIYFAFHDGIQGGLTATIVTTSYYIYIITQRMTDPQEQTASWQVVFTLFLLYLLISIIIGWLKQTIDNLIEREANEKFRLQAIIQQLPVGIIITDATGNIVKVNRHVEMLLGKKMREASVLTPAHAVNFKQWPLAQTLSTGKPAVGRDYIVEREDGKKKHLNISASVIRNKEGKVIAAASIFTDITEQKEMEERKDDFVNMASHELKTPITSMKLYLESLLRKMSNKNGDARTYKTLQSIKAQTDRLQELVSDLLDVSRLQTGKLSFKREIFSLDELITENINELQETTKGGQSIIFAKKVQTSVYADKFRIYQVLTNLLTNAIKYSPEDQNIIVRMTRKNGSIVVSVTDKGIGIAKEQHNKIFQRLYQVTDLKEKTFPGLGMGLYITKEIIKRHKGRIWVESAKEKGSTFYFALPLDKQGAKNSQPRN